MNQLLENSLWELEKTNLEAKRLEIEVICRQYGVEKLSLFGSILRADEFHKESDIDFLVEFLPGTKQGMEFIELMLDLEDLLGRRVDLNTAMSLSRHFRDEVLDEAAVIYAAT